MMKPKQVNYVILFALCNPQPPNEDNRLQPAAHGITQGGTIVTIKHTMSIEIVEYQQ